MTDGRLIIPAEIYLECEDCGDKLVSRTYTENGGGVIVSITPCKRCKDASYDEGYKTGIDGE